MDESVTEWQTRGMIFCDNYAQDRIGQQNGRKTLKTLTFFHAYNHKIKCAYKIARKYLFSFSVY